MKFKDSNVFKLYDLKKNSKFFNKDICELSEDIYFEEDGKQVYIYDIEEGVAELLETLYDRFFKKYGSGSNLEDYWAISIDFTDNSYKFKNAGDALEIFRNKSISDLKSVSIDFDSCGVYCYTDFVVNYDEGIVKKIRRAGYIKDLDVKATGEVDYEILAKKIRYSDYLEEFSAEDDWEDKNYLGSEY